MLESGKKLLIKPANLINLEECHNFLEEQERERRIAVNDEQLTAKLAAGEVLPTDAEMGAMNTTASGVGKLRGGLGPTAPADLASFKHGDNEQSQSS